MTQSPEPSNDHARHDRLLVVRYLDLDDDLVASEVSQARALLASCPDCAALATELQLITDVTNRMVLPARPRGFRLTPQQAASLRPGSVRRFLEMAADAFRFESLRPLAGAAMAIGLLLAVVGALPQAGSAPAADVAAGGASSERAAALPFYTAGPVVPAATAAAAADLQPTAAPAAYPTPVALFAAQSPSGPMAVATSKAATSVPADTEVEPQPAASSGAIAPSTGTTTAYGPATSAESAGVPPAQNIAGDASQAGPEQHTNTISPLLVLGLLLAGVGLMVLLLTFVARRIARSAA